VLHIEKGDRNCARFADCSRKSLAKTALAKAHSVNTVPAKRPQANRPQANGSSWDAPCREWPSSEMRSGERHPANPIRRMALLESALPRMALQRKTVR
jgi:hypothetical protein